jgi:hypothetical protein
LYNPNFFLLIPNRTNPDSKIWKGTHYYDQQYDHSKFDKKSAPNISSLGEDTSQGPQNDPGHPAGRFRNLQSQSQSLDTYNTIVNSLNPSLISNPNLQSAKKNQIPHKNNFLPTNHKIASENPNFDTENQNFASENQRENPENFQPIPRDQNQIDIYEDDWEDDCTPP